MVVDTGLHSKRLTREDALNMFQKYVWDDSDITLKEVTRYQSAPGQATSYMVGQLHIMKLRQYAKKRLGKNFNLKDFHFHVLSQGSVPLEFLEQSIKEYVDCMLNKQRDGCDDILALQSPDFQENGDDSNKRETLDTLERKLYF